MKPTTNKTHRPRLLVQIPLTNKVFRSRTAVCGCRGRIDAKNPTCSICHDWSSKQVEVEKLGVWSLLLLVLSVLAVVVGVLLFQELLLVAGIVCSLVAVLGFLYGSNLD